MERYGWVILTRDHSTDDPWTDSGEGPWGSFELAKAFADAEVGADYVVAALVTRPVHGATGERVGL